MDITCISDLHGFYPDLPGGDLLLLAGDYTAAGKLTQWGEFFNWLEKQNYEKKILIAGNHDNFLETAFPKSQKEADDIREIEDLLDIKVDFEYLCDSGTEYKGLKIWGSPWTNWFHGVNPKCKSFMVSESKLENKFKKIPSDTNILITHSPPYGILDGIPVMYDGTHFHAGSESLNNIVLSVERLPNLKCHIFGHIHEMGGRQFETNFSKFINCSYVNEKYKPVNKPIRFHL